MIVVGSSSKSWISGLDIVSSSWKNFGKVSLLVHCGALKKFQLRGLPGKAFESKILKESHSVSLVCSLRMKELVRALIVATQLSRKKDVLTLRSYRIENFQLGEIVYSRLCAAMHSSHFQMQDIKYSQLLSFTFEAISGYGKARELIAAYPIDQIYVFNGREPLEASFIAAAKASRIKVLIVEKGCDSEHYEIYEKSPHLAAEWWEKMSDFVRQFPEARGGYLDHKAANYARAKSQGFDIWENKAWNSLMNKESPHMPALVSEPYVVFFSSSSKEVSPFDDFHDFTNFESQFDAVEELISEAKLINLTVIIRRHPNSMTPNGIDRESTLWEKFKNLPNVIYLAPNDRTNSYDLMRQAKSVFVWISTIGFDAMVNQKPVHALGAARWDFEGSKRAWNRVDIREALAGKGLVGKDELYTYANYMSHYGTRILICKSITRIGAVLESEDVVPFRMKDSIRARLRKVLYFH